MNNKEKYLKDKNGNPIYCGFEGTCTNYAVEDFTRGHGNFIPLCKEHADFLAQGYWYIPDENGFCHPSLTPPQESLMFSKSNTVDEQ